MDFIEEIEEYESMEVAKYLKILAMENQNKILNVTKVQKLLYITYAYYLVRFDRKFINESPQAWPYGPVFPKTRRNFDELPKIENIPETITRDSELTSILSEIITRYNKYTATQLSDWSHKPGSPWDYTQKQSGFKWGDRIPDDIIKKYFDQFNFGIREEVRNAI